MTAHHGGWDRRRQLHTCEDRLLVSLRRRARPPLAVLAPGRAVVGSSSAEATPPRRHQACHEHVRRAADERLGHRADVLLELRAQRGARGLMGLEREPEREAPAALCGDCVASPRRSS
jgi:hypothetical protein